MSHSRLDGRPRRHIRSRCNFVFAALTTPAAPGPGPAGVVPPPAIHSEVTSGMPGWQITLIAAGAAQWRQVRP